MSNSNNLSITGNDFKRTVPGNTMDENNDSTSSVHDRQTRRSVENDHDNDPNDPFYGHDEVPVDGIPLRRATSSDSMSVDYDDLPLENNDTMDEGPGNEESNDDDEEEDDGHEDRASGVVNSGGDQGDDGEERKNKTSDNENATALQSPNNTATNGTRKTSTQGPPRKKTSDQPIYNRDTAQDVHTKLICKTRDDEPKLPWKQIASRVNEQFGLSTAKDNALNDGACRDRYFRNRITCAAEDGRNIPFDWLKEWIPQSAQLPTGGPRQHAQKVLDCLKKQEAIPASAVDGCLGWLDSCTKEVRKQQIGANTQEGRPKKKKSKGKQIETRNGKQIEKSKGKQMDDDQDDEEPEDMYGGYEPVKKEESDEEKEKVDVKMEGTDEPVKKEKADVKMEDADDGGDTKGNEADQDWIEGKVAEISESVQDVQARITASQNEKVQRLKNLVKELSEKLGELKEAMMSPKEDE